MPNAFTADEIIRLARDLGRIGNVRAQGAEDEDLLRLLNFYLESTVVPAILRERQEYFVRSVREAIVPGRSWYRIHPRSVLGTLRDVRWVNQDGVRSDPLRHLSQSQVVGNDSDGLGTPTGFFVEGNYIHLIPTPDSNFGGYLEQVAVFRPGELVLEASARRIQTANPSARQVQLYASPPGAWTAGTKVDIHSYRSGAEVKAVDIPIGTAATTLTLAGNIDGSDFGTFPVEAGDWVCLAGEAAVPAVPREFHPILAQAIAAKFSESHDSAAAKTHHAALQQLMTLNLDVLQPRVEAKPRRARPAWYPMHPRGY